MKVTNFEQSNKLLKAGLPIDTANAYYTRNERGYLSDEAYQLKNGITYTEYTHAMSDYYEPAWTFNKLMDIALNCVPNKEPFFKLGVCMNLIKTITDALESGEFKFENL